MRRRTIFFLLTDGALRILRRYSVAMAPTWKDAPNGQKGEPPRPLPSLVSQGTHPRKPREVAGWPAERVRQPISSTRVRDTQRVVENRGPPRELAGDVQGRVEIVERNPPDGRHRATRLYRMRPASPNTSTLLYENASGLQLTPAKGAQVLTWTTH